MKNCTTRLKALEPKRWWHYLGIKRKFVDFNIDFTVYPPDRIEFKTHAATDIIINNISIKEVDKTFFEETYKKYAKLPVIVNPKI